MEQTNNKPNTNSSGPNFSMTLADNDSTFSFINKVASQVYPEGKVLIKGTTASQRGFEEKTLVSHNVESIMAGNALSRNPAMASVAYDRLTTSSLESHLAFGSDFSLAEEKDGRKAFEFPNPDFSGDPNEKDKSLTGPAAFKAAISQSVLGTGYAPGFFQQKAYGYSNSIIAVGGTDDGTSVDGGNYQINPDALSIGPAKNNYPAALISDLSDQEKEIYINAITKVNNNVNFDSSGQLSLSGFSINAFQKDAVALKTNYQEAAGNINDQGKEAGPGTSYYRTLPDKFVELNDPSKFYPSITLLKMLIEITDPNGLDLTVNFGFERGRDLISSDAQMTENQDGKKTISDHAFGRGLDIFAVGQKNESGSKLTVNPTNYKKCFELLMNKIALLPKYFQPDEVVISKAMFDHYVAIPKQKKQAFKNAFPGISDYVNFNSDNTARHENHIHIGFHWTRAGNAAAFLGTTSAGGVTQTTMGTLATSVFGTTSDMTKYIEKGQKVYSNQDEKISPVDLGKIMATTGLFNIEEIAVFCGIAERESNITPYRGDGAGPLLALGMFQNELYVYNNAKKSIGSFSELDFYIPEGTSERFALQNGKRTLKGWQIYFNPKTKISQQDLKARDQMTWTIASVDPVFWIPLNQIAVAAQVARIYKPSSGSSSSTFSQFYKEEGSRSVSISRNLWSNWGDGNWGDVRANQSWGAITDVKRSTVKAVYEALGGKWQNFAMWALGTLKVPGALCDSFTVAQVKANARLNSDKSRTVYGPQYRSYWDVFIWVYDLFDEAINYFDTPEEKDQFTGTRWGRFCKSFCAKEKKNYL